MIWPTGWMVRSFVRDHEKVAEQRVRHGYVKLECWTSIFGNLLLGGAKLALGLLTGSIALTADAAHTFGDMISSVVLLVSMRVASAPPDEKHPHGHGRAEALGTLGLAAMLIVTAVEFAHPAFDRLMLAFTPPDAETQQAITAMQGTGWWIVPALLVFWAFKEWMARFSADLGRTISSAALIGDAAHHRSDALATLLVVFSFVGVKFGVNWLDGLFGLGVAGFIGWAGASLAWEMMSRLMGEAPSRDLVTNIVAAAASVRGVRGVHGVEVHDYGNRQTASLHVEVAPQMKTAESHRVATLVEEALGRRLRMAAVVHVEVHEGPPACDVRATTVEEALKAFVAAEAAVLGFHAVHVTTSEKHLSVDLHLTVRPGLPVEEVHRLEHELAGKLRERLGLVKVNVHCEPDKAGAGTEQPFRQ
ncbi:MAG TPA: cation-efflux pump [Planctomycetota bacterium]|nr:cation-efflux pump [Planctomycetota bacterium]